MPPTTGKLLCKVSLGRKHIYSVGWSVEGHVLYTIGEGVYQWKVGEGSHQPKLIHKMDATDRSGPSVAPDGTWVVCVPQQGYVDIMDPSSQKVTRWRPPGMDEPEKIAINDADIYIKNGKSKSMEGNKDIRRYSRQLQYQGEFDLSPEYNPGEIFLTPDGHLLATSQYEGRVYVYDGSTGHIRWFGEDGTDTPEHNLPNGVCVTRDKSILVCNQDCVSVCDWGGRLLHNLELDGGEIYSLEKMSIHEKAGQPTMMVLGLHMDGQCTVAVYSLQ